VDDIPYATTSCRKEGPEKKNSQLLNRKESEVIIENEPKRKGVDRVRGDIMGKKKRGCTQRGPGSQANSNKNKKEE